MAKRQMVINYVAGEECRVAVLEDGKLEEFHSERADSASHVGSIYLGTVVNVEPAIQAAFVDFGLEQSGFLHVSDLHPRYFPGEDEETTERVGKKTPRRERPPIQQCLRRGQEIAVQVLKEGVGTKGPTLTSYLSIPGRFLVMMPLMDKVGVSRKVEDEETRRKMREILDQLDLPEGFGFILRTAGLERTKLELKRDLAYLLRLWKDIEKRWKQGARPRLLYSESDLLVRSLRDMLSTDIDRIVIDNESALKRAARFLKIVAPRSAANLVYYTGKTPLFHAMGIEPQIRNIHAREVPLPSGGRLVIDETEALVAIDVNSGKSREARDAETNAYETNMEAADEICRQLRLRDLGGIVVNDLIDMRSAKHRREVENRFKELLKKDRARSTVAPISPFGILEMTRQRMRGSQESMHFTACPTCRGRGLVQKPDSVADDATRELATLLEYPRVARVQMVVSPRLAGELLSSKRHTLNRLERLSGKRVEVRVSEAVPVDRVSFYAYDDRGADIDTAKLPAPKLDEKQLTYWEQPAAAAEDWTVDVEKEAAEARAEELAEPPPAAEEELLAEEETEEELEGFTPTPLPVGKKKRRRRRRGRGKEGAENGQPEGSRQQQEQAARQDGGRPAQPRREAPAPAGAEAAAVNGQAPQQGAAAGASGEGKNGEGGRRRRRRRRGRGGRGEGSEAAPAQQPVENGAAAEADEEREAAEERRSSVPQVRGGIRYGNYDDDEVIDGAEAEAETEAEAEPAEPVEAAEEAHEAAVEDEPAEVVAAEPEAEAEPESEAAEAAEGGEEEEADAAHDASRNGVAAAAEGGEGGAKRRRRRRRGGKDRAERAETPAAAAGAAPKQQPAPQKPKPEPKAAVEPKPKAKAEPVAAAAEPEKGDKGEKAEGSKPQGQRGGKGRRSRGGRGEKKQGEKKQEAGKPEGGKQPQAAKPAPAAGGGKSGEKGTGGSGGGGEPKKPQPAPAASAPAPAAGAKPRTLYAFRRKLSASERTRINPDA